MKKFIVYLPSGQVVRFGDCQDDTFDLQKGEGEYLLQGEFTGNQYVNNYTLIDMPPKPSLDYVFDYQIKEWMFDTFNATQQAYAKRDELLRNGVDRISPVWWASMTEQEQQAWSQYRQDLLNVPQQQQFPQVIDWPVSPDA